MTRKTMSLKMNYSGVSRKIDDREIQSQISQIEKAYWPVMTEFQDGVVGAVDVRRESRSRPK